MSTSVEAGDNTIGLNVGPSGYFYNYGTVTVMGQAPGMASGDTLEIEGYYYDNNNNGTNYNGTTVESGGTLTINTGSPAVGYFYINDVMVVYGQVNNLYTSNVTVSYSNTVDIETGGNWCGYPYNNDCG